MKILRSKFNVMPSEFQLDRAALANGVLLRPVWSVYSHALHDAHDKWDRPDCIYYGNSRESSVHFYAQQALHAIAPVRLETNVCTVAMQIFKYSQDSMTGRPEVVVE